jgi:hypothetical protein
MKQTKGTTGRYPNNPYGGYKMAPSTNPPQAVASSLFLFHPPAYRSSQGYLGYFVTCTTLYQIFVLCVAMVSILKTLNRGSRGKSEAPEKTAPKPTAPMRSLIDVQCIVLPN